MAVEDQRALRPSASTSVYTFEASGDLDEDGSRSTFELAAGTNSSAHTFRSPSIYVADPMVTPR